MVQARRLRPLARGYLMLEVMVAGAVLTVALTSLVGMLAQAQVDLTKAAHRDRAAGLAAGKASEIEANAARTPFTTGPVAVGAAYAGYTWTFSLADANAVEAATDCDGTPLSTQLYRITATVQYPARHASTDDMRDGVADGLASVVISRVVQ